MDENMTEHLVNVQQQALQLAMIVQRIEDGQNSAAGQSGESMNAAIYFWPADPYSATGCLIDDHQIFSFRLTGIDKTNLWLCDLAQSSFLPAVAGLQEAIFRIRQSSNL